MHNPSATTTAASQTRPSRIEYEPYKRRATTTLPSPTMSTSMYEVFNWGYANDANNANPSGWSSTPFRTGKRMQLSIASPQINIDDPLVPNNRSGRGQGTFHGGGAAGGGGGGGGGISGGVGIGSVVPANGERERGEEEGEVAIKERDR